MLWLILILLLSCWPYIYTLDHLLSPYHRRHPVSASCTVFLAGQFLTCVYVHVLSLLLAIRLSCLIAMATNTMEVNGNCNVVSLPCFTGQRNWSFCELRVFDNVRRIKAIRWLILLPHTGTLDPLMTDYAASVAYTASVSQVLQDVKELSQSGTCQLLLNWLLFMNKLLS